MSDDWNVGDLIVCISTKGLCGGYCYDDGDPRLVEGRHYTIAAVIPPYPSWAPICFDLHEAPVLPGDGNWCSCTFRKVRPDAAQECETEFVTLLKRSKRRVDA